MFYDHFEKHEIGNTKVRDMIRAYYTVRTSSAATHEPEVVEDGYAGGRQGPVVAHIGRRVLVVARLHDDHGAVGHLVQDDHLERYGQRLVGPPVAGQHGTEYGRAARGHHLFAVDGPYVLQDAGDVLLVHRVDVLQTHNVFYR